LNSLFAIVFDDRSSADAALGDLARLQGGQVLTLRDAVFVTRSADGDVKLDQSVNVAAAGALSGAFWGSLIGLIFLSPLLGAAVGAAAGGVSGYLTDYGVDDAFAREMGEKLEPGRTALFILASNVTPERVAEALRPRGGDVFYSSFAPEVEQRFRQGLHPTPPVADSSAVGTSGVGTSGVDAPAHLSGPIPSTAAAMQAAIDAVSIAPPQPQEPPMTEQQKPHDRSDDELRRNDGRAATARTDAIAPTTDDELNQALEDTFPASDPINFAGSSAGRSSENAENPPVRPPASPPVGTHPLAGSDDRDAEAALADVGGDARNDRQRQ